MDVDADGNVVEKPGTDPAWAEQMDRLEALGATRDEAVRIALDAHRAGSLLPLSTEEALVAAGAPAEAIVRMTRSEVDYLPVLAEDRGLPLAHVADVAAALTACGWPMYLIEYLVGRWATRGEYEELLSAGAPADALALLAMVQGGLDTSDIGWALANRCAGLTREQVERVAPLETPGERRLALALSAQFSEFELVLAVVAGLPFNHEEAARLVLDRDRAVADAVRQARALGRDDRSDAAG